MSVNRRDFGKEDEHAGEGDGDAGKCPEVALVVVDRGDDSALLFVSCRDTGRFVLDRDAAGNGVW